MKKPLMISTGEHFVARMIKTTLLLLTALALATGFWVASTPTAKAQESASSMISSMLPKGTSAQSAGKADYLSAVCGAVKKWRSAAPQIVRSASEAHPAWKKDILRTAFQCLGNDDCRMLRSVLRAAISAHPKDASGLTEVAVDAAPGCSDSFGTGGGGGAGGGGGVDEGNYSNPPGNLNPPPGSIGGGGGQGNVVAVCFNGQTLFVTPERAQQLVNQGATVGGCQVTASVNQ